MFCWTQGGSSNSDPASLQYDWTVPAGAMSLEFTFIAYYNYHMNKNTHVMHVLIMYVTSIVFTMENDYYE